MNPNQNSRVWGFHSTHKCSWQEHHLDLGGYEGWQFALLGLSLGKDGNLSIEVYRKPTHIDHPLEQTGGNPDTKRLGPEVSLIHREKTKGIDTHQESAIDMWLKWTFVKSSKRRHKEPPKAESEKQKNVIPYLVGLLENFWRFFQKRKFWVNFKLGQTLRKRLVYPKAKTTRH